MTGCAIGYNTFMLYIITALSAEARPFIDHLRLKRVENALPCPLFRGGNACLPVTQAGDGNGLRFGVSEKEDDKLLASDIADIIKNTLQMRPGSAVTEVTVRAQRFGITKKRNK